MTTSIPGAERYGSYIPYRVLSHHEDICRETVVIDGLSARHAEVGGATFLAPQAARQLADVQERAKGP